MLNRWVPRPGITLSSSCLNDFRAYLEPSNGIGMVLFHTETTLRDTSSWEDDKPWPEAKTLFEINFNNYLRDARLEEAKRLLRGGQYGVAWFPQGYGFSSGGYFIHVFKKSTGKHHKNTGEGSKVERIWAIVRHP